MSEVEHCKAELEVTEQPRGEVNADRRMNTMRWNIQPGMQRNTSLNVDEVQMGEEEFGARRPVRKQDPKEPTKAEREEHEKTHLPFRSWCRHCVRGRGKEEACRRVGRDPEVLEVHMEFMFMDMMMIGLLDHILAIDHIGENMNMLWKVNTMTFIRWQREKKS